MHNWNLQTALIGYKQDKNIKNNPILTSAVAESYYIGQQFGQFQNILAEP